MKKLINKIIHLWIMLVSLFVFGIGWISLSHAEKPAPLVQFTNTSIVYQAELDSIPSLEEIIADRGTSPAPSFNFVSSAPRLRTMGS